MRISSSVVAVLVASAGVAHAEQKPVVQKALTATASRAQQARDGRVDATHTLGLVEINDGVKGVSPSIERCYLDAALDVKGAGHLDITLVIHRNGRVQSVDIKTPGLAKARAEQIQGCVRSLVAPLQFPERKAFTTAVVPYFFQNTAAPNSGPQYSCWNPNGCRVEGKTR